MVGGMWHTGTGMQTLILKYTNFIWHFEPWVHSTFPKMGEFVDLDICLDIVMHTRCSCITITPAQDQERAPLILQLSLAAVILLFLQISGVPSLWKI